MRRRTLLELAGAAAVAETLAIACVGPTPAPTAAPTTARAAAPTPAATPARPTGRISVYSALDESTSSEIIKAFKAAHPWIAVDLLPRAEAGELWTRIRVEKQSPKADLFLGGDSSLHDGLGTEGLLEEYGSPNASAIAVEARDPNGFWTGWYFGVLGFAVNTDRLRKEVGGKAPRSWDDLLDPAWRGTLVLPDPGKTDAGYVFLATQVFRSDRDEAKAVDYMKRLHLQVAQYLGRDPEGIRLVSQGRFAGGPGWSHDILTERARDPGIALVLPEDTSFGIGAVSLLKGRPSAGLPAARAFVDWILTKEAGELNVKLTGRLPVRKDVTPAAGATTLDQLKLVSYDRTFASSNKERLIRAWQAAVRP